MKPYVKKQVKVTLCAVLGNMLVGYTLGWSAPITPKLKDPAQTPLPYPILDEEASWAVTTVVVGSIVGFNVAGYIANKIGRKYCMLAFSLLNLVGYVVIANAKNYAAILVGRTMAGLASAVSVINLVYIGEIASPDIRGSLLTMSGIFHVLGTVTAYSIGPYVSFAVVSYVSVAISCCHALAMCYIPESPLYCMIKGKEKEAKAILLKLGRSDDIDKELRPTLEVSNVTSSPKVEGKSNPSVSPWKQFIFEKKNRKAFLITTALFCFQVSGGVLAILFYATTIFKSAQSSVDPNIGTVILGLTELFGVTLTPLLVEKCGRRILLLISTGFCSLCMGILGTYFYLEVTNASLISSVRWLPLVLLVISLFTFNIGLGIIPNTIAGEMYSPSIRSIGLSLSITVSSSLMAVTSASFGYIVAVLRNHGVFWLYSAINVLGFLFTALVVPETRGKTLMEIGYLLEK